MARRNRPSESNRASGPTTREDFQAAIEKLVRTTAANGVRVEGGFGLRHPAPDTTDWGLEITPLRKQRMMEADRDRPETGRE